MRKEQLQDAIGQLEDDILREAQEVREKADEEALGESGGKRLFRYSRVIWAAAAGVVVICSGIYGIYRHQQPMRQSAQKEIVQNNQEETGASVTPNDTYTVASPQYPEMEQYPDNYYDRDGNRKWRDSRRAQLEQPEGYAEGFEEFFSKTAGTFLKDAEGENCVYSPLNVYMASSLLAEVSDGESRRQVLDLLQVEDVETLRDKASALWNASYCQDGVTTRLLANSIWLNDNLKYKQDTMDTLAQHYYASSHQGKMGSDDYNHALQNWINEQTGNLLREQAGQIEMDERTMFQIVSTIYFQAKWSGRPFDESKTEPDVFHGGNGDITCDFMHKQMESEYYQGQGYSAAKLGFEIDGGMWLILPEEGKTVEDILEQGEWGKFLFHNGESEQGGEYIVNLSMPKFDVTSQLDLKDGFKSLGVTDVFESGTADFSPIIDENWGIFLSRIRHAARVSVDENGCTATAFTSMEAFGSGAMPSEEIDFNLNRPFLFVIVGGDGLPLFTGVVNQP